jgi:VIT1/CCC1 family predicted Fe2+/Mn2+ transporter
VSNYSPGNYAVAQKTNGKAIASLVLSLLGFSILGVIFGHIARGEIRRSNNTQTGDGLALAGLIIGWVGTSLWTLFWFLVFVAAAFA